VRHRRTQLSSPSALSEIFAFRVLRSSSMSLIASDLSTGTDAWDPPTLRVSFISLTKGSLGGAGWKRKR
jgi:hypothetical protein